MFIKTGDLSKEEVVEALAIYAIEKLNAAGKIDLKIDDLLILKIRTAIKTAFMQMKRERTNILKSMKIGDLKLDIMVDLSSVNQSMSAGFRSDTYDILYSKGEKESAANTALQGKLRASSTPSPTSTISSPLSSQLSTASPTPPVFYFTGTKKGPTAPSPLTLSDPPTTTHDKGGSSPSSKRKS